MKRTRTAAMKELIRTRTGAVLCGAAVLALFTGGGAVAHGIVTGEDIKNQSVKKIDIGRDAVGSDEVVDGSLGMTDLNANTRGQINQGGPSVIYVDRVVTSTSEALTEKRVSCPTDTQVITGFVLPGSSNAAYSLGSDYVDPPENAWVVRMGASGPGEGTLPVRLVCLG